MMKKTAENSQKQNDQTTEHPALSVGSILRETREKLGMSIEDVAAQIKLAPRQIEALEADDLSKLPELAFVRGFIRSYAKILRLDAQDLLSSFHEINKESAELAQPSVDVPYPEGNGVQKQNLIWSGLGILLAVLAIIFAVGNDTDPVSQTGDKQEASAVSASGISASKPTQDTGTKPVLAQTKAQKKVKAKPTSVETKPSKQSIVTPINSPETPAIIPLDLPPNPGELHVEFDGESWLEVKDRDGYILVSRLYEPGSDGVINGNMPFSVLVGQASNSRLYFKNQEVDLLPHTRTLTDVAHLTLE
ncbi:MAG: DUF4115 domain-containing protein [Gallionella sp.]